MFKMIILDMVSRYYMYKQTTQLKLRLGYIKSVIQTPANSSQSRDTNPWFVVSFFPRYNKHKLQEYFENFIHKDIHYFLLILEACVSLYSIK